MKRWSKRGLSLMVSALVLLALMPAALGGGRAGVTWRAVHPAHSGKHKRKQRPPRRPAAGRRLNKSHHRKGQPPPMPLGNLAAHIEPAGEPGARAGGAEEKTGRRMRTQTSGARLAREKEPSEDTAPAGRATGAPLVEEAGGVLPAAAVVTVTGTVVTLDGLEAGKLEDEIQAIVDDYTHLTTPADITTLTVWGEMSEADMTYIWKGEGWAYG